MNRVLLLFIVIAAAAANVIKDPSGTYKEGDRFFYFPDDDGKLHLVDTHKPVDEEFIKEYTRNPENNVYFLYTRSNPTSPQTLEIFNLPSITSSYFDPAKATVFLVHGWNGNGQNGMNRILSEAFLQDDDLNVISLDWSELASKLYLTSKNGVPAVGRGLGQFINWLVAAGLTTYEQVHLIGFSLGGQLLGSAGRETSSRIQRITSLDPAGPLWESDEERIVASDAKYVEIIHTNTRLYGFSDPCGDADFYPNGGVNMPGCISNDCDHGRAVHYFAASVKYNHMLANQCESMTQVTLNRCTGPLEPMGNSDLNKHVTGIYRGNTGRNYPY